MMRNLFLALFFSMSFLSWGQDSTAASTTPAPAQSQDDEPQYIFGSGEFTGGWGGLSVKGSHIDGLDAVFIGAKGGVMFDDHITIGLAGSWFVSPVGQGIQDTISFVGGQGGFFIEPAILAKKPVHFTVPLIIGAGGIAHNVVWDEDTNNENKVTNGSAFFLFEPGLTLEMNMTKFMRIQLGGSYRFAYGLNLEGVDSQALNDWTAELCLKFGAF